MIRYSLACADGHEFESWFASAEGFDVLAAAGQLACPDCGTSEVAKSLMAPGVRTARTDTPADAAPLSTPRTPKETALAAIRAKIEAESDYVGLNFATEARAMHVGDKPTRSIYGEAKAEDARSLIDDGVPVAPLPFKPRARAN